MDSNNQGSITSSNAAISTGTGTVTATTTATATTTITSNETNVDQRVLVLRLDQNKPSVSFSTDTIDNENMGKKSSKRCCIYHKIKKFAESDSDESDSDTEIAAKAPNQGKLLQRYHA
jgi:protein phosphatase 1 regulatory subunit 11